MKFVPSTHSTAKFYDNLVQGHKSRKWLGMKNRYESRDGAQEYLIEKYFSHVVAPYINSKSTVLDFGCGPGIFTERIFSLTRNVSGVDISEEFIRLAKSRLGKDTEFFVVDSEIANIENETFDVILLVDVVHHLEDPRETLEKVALKLKPGGLFLIFEPNILSLPIWLLHLIDPNERGLLNLGRKGKYQEIFQGIGALEHFAFNGIVIGPANVFFRFLTDFINSRLCSRIFSKNNPKIFMVFRKAKN
jgi:2-polyprenyl-3-methyl-5-hydroxy-6-metoxy-1,4-benzoquinol methylase